MNYEDGILIKMMAKTFDDFEKRLIKNLPQSEFDKLNPQNLKNLFNNTLKRIDPRLYNSDLGKMLILMFALRCPDIYRRIKEERAN